MIRILFSFFLLVLLPSVVAQKSLKNDSPEVAYEKGIELYKIEKYGLARLQFASYVKQRQGDVSTRIAEAAYLERLCAKKLENQDVLFLWEEYITTYPYSNRLQYAQMHIGDYYLDKNKFGQAARSYEKVKASSLDKETQIDFNFSAGYAFFMEEDYDKSLNYLNAIKDKNTKHSTSVKYFYSHIQYVKGNYQTALEGFKSLEDDNGFKKVVPFYIAQIYYLQGDYANAIKYALPVLSEGSNERKADMNRIVADSYYAQKEYAKCIPYYQSAISLTSKPKREDYYHLGFAYYFTGDNNNALQALSKVTSSEDLMSQNAYYHLGDCYLKLKDKKRARVAFEAASNYDYDKVIQEDALFNYIKLNYELAFSPFNEIINSFLKYIELFPKSDKIDQAYDYLGRAFLTTKNYREALASMEKIGNKAPSVYRAMQRVAYYRGLELFIDKGFAEAIEFFDYSLKYGEYDKNLKVSAFYWRGEAYYRTNNFSKAIEDLNAFIYMPGSYKMKEFQMAHYNIAYAYFKQKEYTQSQSWFRKYLNLTDGKNRPMYGDACNRIGDCYFVERDFAFAIKYYNMGAEVKEASPDYAIFQKGFCLGLQKDYNSKISVLNTLINRYPTSSYVDDALYEVGRSYVALGNLDQAIFTYKTIKEKYPKGSYAKKAMLQLGLVYYNNNDFVNSSAFYKRVVNEFPGTPEAEDALLGIRNIYMDNNDLAGYMTYAKQLGGFAQLDARQQDSLTYVSAEKFYMKSDCQNAVKQFQAYLAAYPTGKYVLNSNFYKADCQYRNGQKAEALISYTYVVNQSRSFFTEEALIKCGELLYQKDDYAKALEMFTRLEVESEIETNGIEAKIGKMRCLYKLNNYNKCIESANQLLALPKIGEEIKREAIYNKATSYRSSNDLTNALTQYELISPNTKSAEGAEAKYWVAQIYKDQAKVDRAEKEVFNYIEKGTSHQYWLARSFILLAEIYHERNESFQAIQYLQSLRDNYEGEDDIQERVFKYLNEWQDGAVSDASTK